MNGASATSQSPNLYARLSAELFCIYTPELIKSVPLSNGLVFMRLSSMPLAFCAIFTCTSLTAQADTKKERDIHCAAYYEVLSVAGDQPDISRSQSSRASYVLLVHAGYTPQAQEEVAQKMVELHKETPGPMTPASTAKLREKYDAECKVLLKAAL